MIDWFMGNKEELGLVALGLVSGVAAALRWIAPLTKTTFDDKAYTWLQRAAGALSRWFAPKGA